MAKQNSTSKPAAEETPKKAVLVESVTRLNVIMSHLIGVKSLLGYIEDDDDNQWAHALSFAVQGIEREVEAVRNFLAREGRF